MVRIYLASSWRNEEQPALVHKLRGAGHEVYDFRHPHLGPIDLDDGFHWSDVDPAWHSWTPEQFRDALRDRAAVDGFSADRAGMGWAQACVLLTPCGRSAHLEAGFMAGQGKPVLTLLREGFEPELMYGLLDRLYVTDDELLAGLAVLEGLL